MTVVEVEDSRTGSSLNGNSGLTSVSNGKTRFVSDRGLTMLFVVTLPGR